jgi:hypothetical protein
LFLGDLWRLPWRLTIILRRYHLILEGKSLYHLCQLSFFLFGFHELFELLLHLLLELLNHDVLHVPLLAHKLIRLLQLLQLLRCVILVNSLPELLDDLLEPLDLALLDHQQGSLLLDLLHKRLRPLRLRRVPTLHLPLQLCDSGLCLIQLGFQGSVLGVVEGLMVCLQLGKFPAQLRKVLILGHDLLANLLHYRSGLLSLLLG